MTKNKTFLPIYNDLVFKNLFGVSKNIQNTTNLLESLFNLEKGTLEGSKIINSVTLDKDTVLNKKFELDIKLEDPFGNIYNLEMQRKLDKNAEIKNFIYITGLFFTNLRPGENYKNMNKVVQLEFVKNNYIHKNKDIIKKYCICNVTDIEDKILEDLFYILIIDVDQDRNTEYNKSNEFESWRRFIGAETKEELTSLVKAAPELEKAKESLRFMEQEYIQDFSREELLYESRLETAKEEGIEEGRIEEKYSIAKEMLKNTNLSLEEISKCTGLTAEELTKIKSEI